MYFDIEDEYYEYQRQSKLQKCFTMKQLASMLNIPGYTRNKIYKLLQENFILNEKNQICSGSPHASCFMEDSTHGYCPYNTRICRPIRVTREGIDLVFKLIKEKSQKQI